MRWLATAVLVFVLYLIAHANYLLYHALIELFSVVVAGLIFSVSWLTKEQEHSLLPSTIGVGYAFVGLLDLIHTIAYKGMDIFAETGSNLATQLWIAGRFLEALVLFSAPLVRSRRARLVLSFGYTIYCTAVLLSIFWWRTFPSCYVEGVGLTRFKIVCEYVVIAILFLALQNVKKSRPFLPAAMVRYLPYSIAATVVSEFCFTLYMNVYDLANFTGHLFKLLSYFLLLYGIVIRCIREPLANLYHSLYQDKLRFEQLASTDPLTGLLNRRVALMLLEAWLERGQSEGLPVSLIMIDIDHFKAVNDNYGHQTGDIVLQKFAALILKAVRSKYDFAGRFGGEEFIVALWNADIDLAKAVAERLRREVEAHDFGATPGKALRVSISLGVAQAKGREQLEDLIARADKALYRAKERGRNCTELAE